MFAACAVLLVYLTQRTFLQPESNIVDPFIAG